MSTESMSSIQSESPLMLRDQRISSYMPLVRRIAYQLSARLPECVSQEDMLQAGIIGLVEAANNYDPSKRASFGTYAGIRIRGAMIDELRRGDWAPRSVHRSSRTLNEAVHRIESKTGIPCSLQELSAELNISINEVSKIIKDMHSKKILSYNDTGIDDDQFSVDMFKVLSSPLEFAQINQQHSILTECISLLPDREKSVLIFHHIHDYPLKQIAITLQISESRVSQLLSDALNRLKKVLEDYNLLG